MKLIGKYLLAFCICLSVLLFSSEAKSQDSAASNEYHRQVPDSVADEMRKDPDFAYANDPSYWEKEKESEPGFLSWLFNTVANSAFFKILLYIVVGVLVVFIVYQVVIANNFSIFSKKRQRRKAGEAENDIDEWENIDGKVNEAIAAGNYRTAVRYMYLKTLKALSENNLITLHSKSTNHEYVQQMYKHAQGAQFSRLTRIYEYVWYGEFIPNESQFEKIRTNFNQFNPHS